VKSKRQGGRRIKQKKSRSTRNYEANDEEDRVPEASYSRSSMAFTSTSNYEASEGGQYPTSSKRPGARRSDRTESYFTPDDETCNGIGNVVYDIPHQSSNIPFSSGSNYEGIRWPYDSSVRSASPVPGITSHGTQYRTFSNPEASPQTSAQGARSSGVSPYANLAFTALGGTLFYAGSLLGGSRNAATSPGPGTSSRDGVLPINSTGHLEAENFEVEDGQAEESANDYGEASSSGMASSLAETTTNDLPANVYNASTSSETYYVPTSPASSLLDPSSVYNTSNFTGTFSGPVSTSQYQDSRLGKNQYPTTQSKPTQQHISAPLNERKHEIIDPRKGSIVFLSTSFR
jgi:hypothetical protein